MISLRMAVHHPDKVSHVITMGSGSGGIKYFARATGPQKA